MAHTNPGTQFDPTWFEKIRIDLPGQVEKIKHDGQKSFNLQKKIKPFRNLL